MLRIVGENCEKMIG